MHSLENRYVGMNFYIDQEGQMHLHFTEDEIREQEQQKKETKKYPYKV